MILAIDPGKDKCGLAVLDDQANVLSQLISLRPELTTNIKNLVNKFPVQTIAIGSGTFSKTIEQEVRLAFFDLKIVLVDERNSTLEARKLYWQDHPPQGLWKLIPLSLRLPPRPIDDYAAVVVGRRFVASLSS